MHCGGPLSTLIFINVVPRIFRLTNTNFLTLRPSFAVCYPPTICARPIYCTVFTLRDQIKADNIAQIVCYYCSRNVASAWKSCPRTRHKFYEPPQGVAWIEWACAWRKARHPRWKFAHFSNDIKKHAQPSFPPAWIWKILGFSRKRCMVIFYS